MSSDLLVCPNCRARVFGDWSACKFCGAVLRVDRIEGTVHPDDLDGRAAGTGAPSDANAQVSGPRSPWEGARPGDFSGGGPGDSSGEGGAPGRGASDWSAWAGAGAGNTPTSPPSASHSTARGGPLGNVADPRQSETGSGALVRHDGADSTWVEGPAPTVSDDRATAAAPGSTDEGPSGLEPVSWYQEPGSDSSSHLAQPADSGATSDSFAGSANEAVAGSSSAGAGVVPFGAEPPPVEADEGPSGLEPVSWYQEPGSGSATEGAASPATDEGSSGLEPVSWYQEPGSAAAQTPPADAGGPTNDGPDGSDESDSTDDADRFDPSAIFREPEPSSASAAGWDTTTAVETAVPQVNWKASASGWDRPVAPEGKAKGQSVLSREARLLIGGILVLLLVFVVGRAVLKKRDNYPNQWAASVQEVANWVSSTRKLPFAHPVAVETLNAADYNRTVDAAISPTDKADKLAEQVATLRALGAVEGNPSGVVGLAAIQPAVDGAFYDPSSRKLYLRGGTDSEQLRVGVAAAMSIALDDQHGDLSSLRTPSLSESPLLSVVAGNAERMRVDYLATQSTQVRQAFEERDAKTIASVDSFLSAQSLLEGTVGGPFVQLVDDVNGTEAASQLVEVPPVSAQQVFEPIAYFNGQDPLSAAQPVPPAGAEQLSSGTFGAQNWYLVLAGRLGTDQAFDFASHWSGDEFITYGGDHGPVCFADVVRGADSSSTQSIELTLTDWSKKVPATRVKIERPADNLVSVTTCDPGAKADQALKDTFAIAVQRAALRSELAAAYYLAGTKIPNGPNGPLFAPKDAWCMANQVARSAQPSTLTSMARQSGSAYRAATIQAGEQCGVDTVGELFTNGAGS